MNKRPGPELSSGIVKRSRTNAQARGDSAERLAETYLARHGCHTLARNFRCKAGEIDLICEHDGAVVFVEVRLRRNSRFGSAADSITYGKRERIMRAARWWLAGPGQHHAARPCRFDVITLNRLSNDAIDWIPAAFDAS